MTNRERLANYKLEIVALSEEDGGGYQAFYPQLARSAVGYGQTPDLALEDLKGAIELLLCSLQDSGEPLPLPTRQGQWEDFSGRVTLRVSKTLHFRLARLADAEGLSLNGLMSEMLQSAATALEAGLTFGAVTSRAKPADQRLNKLTRVS